MAYWYNANPAAMMATFFQSPYFLQKGEAHQKKYRCADYLPNIAQIVCATLRSTAHEDKVRCRQQNLREER
ncbi:MAG: hypothetical protein PHH84_09285 [Oscillospiraceae bacterium]|nr:hypothetical protein [Oscillospiraceae bacterium]MDD4414947.1 hypothetical protein [Oscillospiraceae bacterium]